VRIHRGTQDKRLNEATIRLVMKHLDGTEGFLNGFAITVHGHERMFAHVVPEVTGIERAFVFKLT